MNKKQKKDALVIGIDIHPTCIAAAALDQNGNTLWTHKRVEMFTSSLRAFQVSFFFVLYLQVKIQRSKVFPCS